MTDGNLGSQLAGLKAYCLVDSKELMKVALKVDSMVELKDGKKVVLLVL